MRRLLVDLKAFRQQASQSGFRFLAGWRRPVAPLAAVGCALIVAGCASSGLTLGGPNAKAEDTSRPTSTAPATVPTATAPATDPGTTLLVNGSAARSDLTRVAFLAPLSGTQATAGQTLANAAQMAMFDQANTAFVLQTYDTQGTPQGAAAAADAALADGARLILGPLFSASVKAVTPKARAAGIPIISFSSNPGVAGNGTYATGFLPREQARRLAEFARSQGLTRFAVLSPDDDFGHLMSDAFITAVQDFGGEVVRAGYFGPNGEKLNDITARVTDLDGRRRLLESQKQQLAGGGPGATEALARLDGRNAAGEMDFEALLLPVGGQQLKEVLALLQANDVDFTQVRLLGPYLWRDNAVRADIRMTGAWYPSPPPDSTTQFERRYHEMFGAPPMAIGAFGYDVAAIAAILGKAGGPFPFTTGALTTPRGFGGVNGLFRLMPDGTVQRALAVMELRPEGAVLVGPAATRFPQTLPAPGTPPQPTS